MSKHKNTVVFNEQMGGLKICVLQPDYSTSDVDYKNYDPPRDLSSLLPNCSFDHVFLNKLTTYKQLKELSKKNYDVFVNLCEGYLEWSVPSVEVIYFLELLNLPFTGPTSVLYDPPKDLMKYVAYTQNVSTPKYWIVNQPEDLDIIKDELCFPLFVKPLKSGDSLGIDDNSLVNNFSSLKKKVAAIIDEYSPLLIEEYINGKEYTVMVVKTGEGIEAVKSFVPVEYVFPNDKQFKTYALKTSELHTNANIPVTDLVLAKKLKTAAENIFTGFGGVGYARLDFRMNETGGLFFLEINFTCSVFYTNGYEGSADYILKSSQVSPASFLIDIIKEGIFRHERKQKKYHIKGNSIAGYGIYAANDLEINEVVFRGEEKAQRIATQSHINKKWSVKEKEIFKKYAYPVSNEVFLLWDENPAEWAPQNHCCDANTGYVGLDVVALRAIKKGEELTLDYADFLDEEMEPFNCKCGSRNCRGFIKGTNNNTISSREFRRTH